MRYIPESFLYRRRNRGSILVIAIWVMVFFSVLCAGLYGIISAQIRLVKRVEDSVICEYLAKAAVAYAMQERASDETDFDTLYELGSKRERELGYGEFVYSIIDEGGKINVNTAPEEDIARLPGFNTELAMQLIEARTGPFHTREEILLVDGVTEEVYKQSKDFITVYSDGKVNINTAPQEVLAALGLDAQVVEAIVEFRKGADSQEATEDDEFFEDTGQIIDKLRSFRGLSEIQEAFILELISQGKLTTACANFTLDVETQVLNKPSMRYSIVMDEEKIRQWQEW